jgi:hypothetical protein
VNCSDVCGLTRLQLALPPYGVRPLAVLRGGLVDDG